MQYELVQNTSTLLIVFIAIAGVSIFVQLFIHAYWTFYRHQRSPKQQPYNKVPSQPSPLELSEVKLEPKQLDYDNSYPTSVDVVILEVKHRPFWYSIG